MSRIETVRRSGASLWCHVTRVRRSECSGAPFLARRSRTAGSCVNSVRLKCRSTPFHRCFYPRTPPLPPAFPAPHFPSSLTSLPVSPCRNLRMECFPKSIGLYSHIHVDRIEKRKKKFPLSRKLRPTLIFIKSNYLLQVEEILLQLE